MLAAAQGVCGNDTARAAEIPPPDIGWKVEQLVRDNQWRSIAVQARANGAGGRGGGAAWVGAPMAEVKKQTSQEAEGPGGVTETHNLYRETPLWVRDTTEAAHNSLRHKSPHNRVAYLARLDMQQGQNNMAISRTITTTL